MAAGRRSTALAVPTLVTLLCFGVGSGLVAGRTASAAVVTLDVPPTPTPEPSPGVPPDQSSNPFSAGVTMGLPPAHGVDQQYRQVLVVDGRTVDVYVPGDRPITSLVGLQHPLFNTNSDAESQTAGLLSYGLQYRYLLFYPRSNTAGWNAGGCCDPARAAGQDDTAFLEHVIRFLRAAYRLGAAVPTIDGGISNGAMMAAELYCKRPGLLDGAILASGNLQDATCAQVARVANLLMLRGDRDGTVPIGDRQRAEPLRTYYSDFLRTTMYPDALTINADERGSRCTETARTSNGVTERLIRCGGRVIHYVEQRQGRHGWHGGSGPGTVDESARAAGFINEISLRRRRAVAAGRAG